MSNPLITRSRAVKEPSGCAEFLVYAALAIMFGAVAYLVL